MPETPDTPSTLPFYAEFGAAGDGASGRRKFLSFILGREEYAVDILKVQEIRNCDSATRVPGAPAFIKGLVNLRGAIVPIVDMRVKFNVGEPVYDRFTVVIILSLGGRLAGIVVDSVADVVSLAPEQIQPAPDCGAAVSAEYMIGLSSVGERMLILLDIDGLMASEEMALTDRSASA